MVMAWITGGVLLLIVLVLIAIRLPITVEVQLYKGVEHYQGHLRLRWLFGLVRAERNLLDIHPIMTAQGPSVHVDVHKGNPEQQTPDTHLLTPRLLLRYVRKFRSVFRLAVKGWPVIVRFLNSVKVAKFDTKLTFGTGDAPSTGVVYGLTWSGCTTAVGFLSRLLQFEQRPRIQVLPNFQQRTFDVSQLCIFRIVPGYAIAAAFRLYRVKKRA